MRRGMDDARKAAREALLSGYRHHSYELEHQHVELFLKQGNISLEQAQLRWLDTYADVLAPQPFRAMQNALICLITVVCRVAIQLGVDVEQSFSFSDFYVYKVESCKNRRQLESLIQEVLESYATLVREERVRAFSLPVTRGIRYIHSHLYEPCRVIDIAVYVRLHPRYFSALFQKEVGIRPIAYICTLKMNEAKVLLQNGEGVAETAEALGYCSSSHFAAEFKRLFGRTPLQFTREVSRFKVE